MTRGLCTMLLFTCLLVVFGSLADAQQPGPGPGGPTFTAVVGKAVKNPVGAGWNVNLTGSFSTVAASLQVGFQIQSKNNFGNVIATTSAPIIVEVLTGAPFPQQLGIVRTPTNLANGTYTGNITIAAYTPLVLTYKMQISYYTNGRFHKFYVDANGNDWIPVP